MLRTNRDYQIRLNSLDFLHLYDRPFLDVDGLKGPKTREAVRLAMDHFDWDRPSDIFDPYGVSRIHWHWTGGSYTVSSKTLKHYNDVHDFEGQHFDGAQIAIRQVNYDWRAGIGVSHTLNANTGAIGQSVACMNGATVDWSKGVVDPGKYPITWAAIDSMLERSAEYCEEYDIRVSPWTTLTHAEIGPNLGIKQRGKWDIRVLPDDPQKLLSAKEAGDKLRKRLKDIMA